MNKILLDNENLFDKNSSILLEVDNTTNNINIELLKNIEIDLTILDKNNNLSLNIKLNEKSKLKINVFTINGTFNTKVDLYKNSEFYLNNSILSNIDSYNEIIINHLESNSISKIKNHGFSKYKAKLIFDVNGKIVEKASKCICNQDNQIIENENSFSTILPKLYIDNYDVEANHAAYVGEFKEEELFYLMSRGMDLETSKFLLLNAFLLGYLKIPDEYKSKLRNTILKYFEKEV